jgi:hypothetical protein
MTEIRAAAGPYGRLRHVQRKAGGAGHRGSFGCAIIGA